MYRVQIDSAERPILLLPLRSTLGGPIRIDKNCHYRRRTLSTMPMQRRSREKLRLGLRLKIKALTEVRVETKVTSVLAQQVQI